ncbi:uncharacterized protein [Misgurnus anguillicaudatus]|uniref:uncharacterized protein n=1 Tax=Misgurnus anguillicaudatus TaxID=75329 RepID=UPI003CCF0756
MHKPETNPADRVDLAERARQAHRLFGLRQKEAEVFPFAVDFVRAARDTNFSEDELKVIFSRCLNEPLNSGEMRMLRYLGFEDLVRYISNRPEPRASARAAPPPAPLPPIPEGITVGVLALEDPAITTPVPATSVQPPDLGGKRQRRVSWESPSEGSSSKPAAPTTVLTSPATASVPRPRKKRRRRGVVDPQLAQPPLQPQPSAQPPLQPQPSAQLPLQPQPSAQPPLQPLPSAQPPLQPLPSAQPPLQPLPSAQPPLQPLPSAQPPLQPPVTVSVSSPLPDATAPVSSPLPDAAPPVTAPVSSPLPAAAPPVTAPVSSPLPAAAPPVSPAPSVASSRAPSSCLSAWSPATVSMSSLNSLPYPVSPGSPPSAPLSTPTTSWNPALPPFVPLSQPASITKPAPSKIPTKPARTPRPKPSNTPEPKTPCPPSSTLPGLPHLNIVLPPPPLPCLLFLLCHPNPFVVYSCLPLCIFVMFSWCMSICQSVLSCV